LKLHLGCSNKRLPLPWLNCDSLPGSDWTLNLLDLSDLATNSCSQIYSSHTIEHIEFDSIPGVLAGLHRVIRPGGKLTLATIDIVGIYRERYLKGVRAASWLSALYGDSHDLDRPFVSHRCAFDARLLTQLLQDAGFHDVRSWEPCEYPEILNLHDCASTDRDVSLLLEGLA
jgi:predicted SAM-dependent methyltransferase